jgi:hypothetical protein
MASNMKFLITAKLHFVSADNVTTDPSYSGIIDITVHWTVSKVQRYQ